MTAHLVRFQNFQWVDLMSVSPPFYPAHSSVSSLWTTQPKSSYGVYTHQKRLKSAAAYNQRIQQQVRKNKFHLYAFQLPFSGLVGVVSYHLLKQLNPENKLIKDFNEFYQTFRRLKKETLKLEDLAARRGLQLSTDFQESLSSLRLAIQTGQSQSRIRSHVNRVKRYNPGLAETQPLKDLSNQYVRLFQRILRNKHGLTEFAKEHLVAKNLSGLSPQGAKRMLLQNRHGFVSQVLKNLVEIQAPQQLHLVLTRLSEVHLRIPRLVASVLAVGMGGYSVTQEAYRRRQLLSQHIKL